MRSLFIILLTIWTLFSWYYYVCKIQNACWGGNNINATTIPNSKQVKPLYFRWSSHNIPLDGGFNELHEVITSQKEDSKVLSITGHYYLAESTENPTYDLGLARASEVKKRLLDEFPENQIQIFSSVLPPETIDTDSLVEAIQFEWVDAPTSETSMEDESTDDDPVIVEEAIEESVQEEAPNINKAPIATDKVESDNSDIYNTNNFVKYFPYNQTRLPSEITDFLDLLSERVLSEEKRVIIRGHTDSQGEKEKNFKVGLRRAKKVRDYLMEKGIAKSDIETTSDGEDTPIASNKTEEGRRQNRRIEIILE